MFDFMDMDYGGESTAPGNSGPYIPEASDCMRCGMCVSTCPTYKLFQINEETPRQRIRTISKLLVENQLITETERAHLDNCVQCRVCETVCPSRMAYGSLFDQAQTKLQQASNRIAKLAFWLIANKQWRFAILPFIALYMKSGLQSLARYSKLLNKTGLAQADALLTLPSLTGLNGHYPTKQTRRGQVALFTGCVAEHFDSLTLKSAINLLNAIGYDVVVPKAQACCGAIHQHNGQSADFLIKQNIDLFNSLAVDAVLFAATGCGAMLSEYRSEDAEAAELFRSKIHDVSAFLAQNWPDNVALRPLHQTIFVHEPCSQRNVLKNQQLTYDLLAKVPGLNVAALPENNSCCGAGGSYMLSHPENANRLRDMKYQAIESVEAAKVVSSNFACLNFLAAGDTKTVYQSALQILAEQLP